MGTTYYWNNAAGGIFQTGTDWTPNGIPFGTDTAVFDLDNFYTISSEGTAGFLLLETGTVTFAGGIEADGLPGGFYPALEVDGATAIFSAAALLALSEVIVGGTIGDGVGPGTLEFTNDSFGTLTASGSLSALYIGDDNVSAAVSGYVLVDNSTIDVVGAADVGVYSDGTLAVTNTADVQVLLSFGAGAINELDIGVATQSAGTVTVASFGTFDVGEYTVIGDEGTGLVSFTDGATGSFSGVGYDSTAGTFSANFAVNLGLGAGASGTLSLDGAQTSVSADAGLLVGGSGQGLVSLTNGATLAVNPGTPGVGLYFTELGDASGASGTLDVSGGAQLTGTSALFVGASGDGTIAITSGGTVYSDTGLGNVDAALGYQPGGDGTGLIDDGLWFSYQSFSVGYQGSGTLVVQDGGVLQVDGTFLRVARDPGATGTLTVDASDVYAQGAELTVGPDATNAGDGTGGSGTLEIENNAAVYVGGAEVGALAGGAGSIDVTGFGGLNIFGDLSTGAGSSVITAEDSGGIGVNGSVIIGGGGGSALLQLTDYGGLYAYNAGITIAALGTLALDATAALDSGEATPVDPTTGTLTLDGGTLLALDTIDPVQSIGVSIDIAGGSGAQPSAIAGSAGSDLLVTGGISFQPDANATLLLGPAYDSGNTLYDFSSGDTLDVQVTGTLYSSASYDAATGQLVLSDGTDTFALNVADTGSYAADNFVTSSDGYGGTDVTLAGTVFTWNNPAGGSLTDPANWTPTGVPDIADTAEFLIPGPYTVNGDGIAGYVLVEDAVRFTGSIEAAGLAGQFTAFDLAGGGAATFDGGALYAASEARVGDQTGSGTLSFIDGASGTLTASNTATALDIAFTGNAGVTTSGTVLVAGAGTALTLLGGAYVGVDGAGTLAVSQGALVQLTATPASYDSFEVGVEAAASGTVSVTGTATMSLGEVAYIGVYGQGSVAVTTGGTLDTSTAIFGAASGAAGLGLVDAGLFDTSQSLVVGDQGDGTLTVQNGATLVVGGIGLSIGENSGSNSLLTINGASLDASSAMLTVGPDLQSGDGAVGGSGTLEVEGINVSSQASVDDGLIAGLAGGTGSIDVQYSGLTFYGSLVTGAGTSIVTLEDAGGIGVVGVLQIGGGGGAPGQGVADFSIRDGGALTDYSGITLAALGTLGIDATSFIYNEGDSGITLDAGTLDALGSAGFGYDVTIHSGLQITGGTTAAPSALIGTAGSNLVISDGITFADPAVLLLGAAYNPANEINDFAAGDTLDISGSLYNTASYDIATAQLVLTGSSPALTLDVADNGYSADSFSAYSDGTSGTDVSLGPPPPCYLAGTHVMTPDGERRVETLRPGDRVCLAHGGAAPLIWVGERKLDPAAHPRPWEVQPIRIRKGAFAAGLPWRDLLVSPDHALLLHGVLVEAKRLFNDRTIVQETARTVHYFHLELQRHDVLLAEGVAAESYLDTGNRHAFGDGATALHPSFATPPSARATLCCAPFATDPDHVQPIWQRLADRATVLGHAAAPHAATADPALRLLADGRAIAPLRAAGGAVCFPLPRGARRLRLASHAAQPTWCAPWLDDRRTLGVAVARLRLHAGGAIEDLALDSPHLREGWWDLERHGTAAHRWTNGSGVIVLPGAADCLELVARPLDAYPAQPATAAAAARQVRRGGFAARARPG